MGDLERGKRTTSAHGIAIYEFKKKGGLPDSTSGAVESSRSNHANITHRVSYFFKGRKANELETSGRKEELGLFKIK